MNIAKPRSPWNRLPRVGGTGASEAALVTALVFPQFKRIAFLHDSTQPMAYHFVRMRSSFFAALMSSLMASSSSAPRLGGTAADEARDQLSPASGLSPSSPYFLS